MKVLQKITEEELEEVKILVQKRYALKNLQKILLKNNNQEEILKRCNRESEEIEEQYKGWWDTIFDKYHLEQYENYELEIELIRGEIILQ